MKNINPLSAKRRKQQRLQKFTTDNPYCLLCGFSNPRMLLVVTRKFLEDHHIFLKINDPDCALALCHNCHTLVHDGYDLAGVIEGPIYDPERFYRNICRMSGVLYRNLSDAYFRFAEWQPDSGSRAIRSPDLIGYLFCTAFPLWKAHQGNVCADALRQLELDYDWPRGLAKEIMQRISRDTDLQIQLERWCHVIEGRRLEKRRILAEGRIL